MPTSPSIPHDVKVATAERASASHVDAITVNAAIDIARATTGVADTEWLEEDDVLVIETTEDSSSVDVLLAVSAAMHAAFGDHAEQIRLHLG